MKNIVKISFIVLAIGWITFIGFGFVSSQTLSESKTDIGYKGLDEGCRLKNGKYKVIYNKQFTQYQDWTFELKNDTLTEINITQRIKHKVEWISDDQFRISPLEKQTDSLTDIQKQLNSLGRPFFKLSNCKANKMNFEFMRNEHITISTGKIFRAE